MRDSDQQPADPSDLMTRRSLWVIVLTALFFGVFALVYCGRLRRAIAWLVFLWLGVGAVVFAVMLYLPNGRIAVYGGILILMAGKIAFLVDAIRISRRQTNRPWRPYQRWWTYGLLFIGAIVFNAAASKATKVYCAEAFTIQANGMRETLLAGDRILVDKLFFNLKRPIRGSVVVFQPPEQQAINYVKRVIATAGDTIEIKDDQVLVNDQLLKEPYTIFQEKNARLLQFTPELQNYPQREVPADHVFVMGDCRWASLDSRSFGMVPVENLVGVARVIFWSRELSQERPTRENPQGQESWGQMRWDRVGKRVH